MGEYFLSARTLRPSLALRTSRFVRNAVALEEAAFLHGGLA